MVKGEGDKHDDLKAEFVEFKDLKEHFFEVRKERNAKRDLLTKLIDQAKENVLIFFMFRITHLKILKMPLKTAKKASKKNQKDQSID